MCMCLVGGPAFGLQNVVHWFSFLYINCGHFCRFAQGMFFSLTELMVLQYENVHHFRYSYCCAITVFIFILHRVPSLLLDSLFSPGSQSEPQQTEAVHQSPDITVSGERPKLTAGLLSSSRLSALWLRLLAHAAAQHDTGTGECGYVMDRDLSSFCVDSGVCAEAEHTLVNPAVFWRPFLTLWKDLPQQLTWRQAPGGGANTTFRGLT